MWGVAPVGEMEDDVREPVPRRPLERPRLRQTPQPGARERRRRLAERGKPHPSLGVEHAQPPVRFLLQPCPAVRPAHRRGQFLEARVPQIRRGEGRVDLQRVRREGLTAQQFEEEPSLPGLLPREVQQRRGAPVPLRSGAAPLPDGEGELGQFAERLQRPVHARVRGQHVVREPEGVLVSVHPLQGGP